MYAFSFLDWPHPRTATRFWISMSARGKLKDIHSVSQSWCTKHRCQFSEWKGWTDVFATGNIAYVFVGVSLTQCQILGGKYLKKSYKHDLLRLAVGNLLASFIQSWKKKCFILHLMIVAAASVNLVRMQGKVLSLLGMDCSNLWAWCENFSSVQALGIFLVLWNTGILMKQSRTHFNWAESELARERRALRWVLHPAKLCFPTTSWWLCCVLVTFLHRAH